MKATYTILEKEYITTDLLITKDNANIIKYACKKFETIEKEIKQIDRGGLFRKSFALVSVYVPLDKYKEFEQSIEDGIDGDKELSNSTKLLMIGVFLVVLIGVVFFYFKKRESEPNKKPNVFKRLKLWWNKKFSKKTEPSPTIESK